MTDDRVERLIGELETAIEPRPEFGRALFARLTLELERPGADRHPFHWLVEPRRYLLIAVTAALVVVVATTIVVSRPAPASAAEVIRQAQRNIAGLPQVRATVHYDLNPDGSVPGVARGTTAEVEITYVRGVGYRQQIVRTSGPIVGSAGAGGYVVWDGTYLGSTWSAARNVVVARGAAFEPLRELGWSSPYPNWEGICERGGSEVFADAIIAGRAARHVRCGDLYGGSWELWSDRETGFMLKIQGALGRDDFKFGTSAKGGLEVTRIEYAFAVDPSAFTVPAPQGGFPPVARDVPTATLDPYTETSLRRGAVAPSWTGELLDGSRFRLEEARGRPLLVLFWADWCPRGDPACDVLRQYDEISRRYAGRAGFVSVDVQGRADEAKSIMSDLGYRFAVVGDDKSSSVSRTWGVDSVPVWVLLDRDGRVVEVRLRP